MPWECNCCRSRPGPSDPPLRLRFAVEANGPDHYTRVGDWKPLGRTIVRRKLLEKRGWRVLSLPIFEWFDAGRQVRAAPV